MQKPNHLCANTIVPDQTANQGIFFALFGKSFTDNYHGLVHIMNWEDFILGFKQLKYFTYSKKCLKWPLKNRQNKGINDKW